MAQRWYPKLVHTLGLQAARLLKPVSGVRWTLSTSPMQEGLAKTSASSMLCPFCHLALVKAPACQWGLEYCWIWELPQNLHPTPWEDQAGAPSTRADESAALTDRPKQGALLRPFDTALPRWHRLDADFQHHSTVSSSMDSGVLVPAWLRQHNERQDPCMASERGVVSGGLAKAAVIMDPGTAQKRCLQPLMAGSHM